MKQLATAIWRRMLQAPRLLGFILLRGYQLLISPLLPVTCRYYPSCSNYALQAVSRHGLVWGSVLAGWRLLRCNPFTAGGVDDVPLHGWRVSLRHGRRVAEPEHGVACAHEHRPTATMKTTP